jgi:hypothetical protein
MACPDPHRFGASLTHTQAKARTQLGQDVTVFERIFDGLAAISKGDIVRLNTKPAILGRVRQRLAEQAACRSGLCSRWLTRPPCPSPPSHQVEHFSIPQAVQSEGCYSGGRVTVCALPAELLGSDSLHTWPLRRLEGKVTEAELAEHVSRELGKVWP